MIELEQGGKIRQKNGLNRVLLLVLKGKDLVMGETQLVGGTEEQKSNG